jgi:hypothetical protein
MVAVVAVLGAACGGSKASTSPTTKATALPTTTTATTLVPAGYSPFADTTDKFTIAVPAAWRQIDPASAGATQVFADVVKANPKLSSLLGSGPADLVAKGIKFFGVDVSGATDFAPNVNVIVKAALGATDSDLPQAVAALKTQYTQIGATVTSTATVPLAGHQALQVKVQLPLTTPAGAKTTVAETQDLVAANDLIYILTFAGVSADFSTIESSFALT